MCLIADDHGLRRWVEKVAKTSPRIKGPHHPPRRHLRHIEDEVEGFCARKDEGHGHLDSVSEDGPAVTARVGRPGITSYRVLEGGIITITHH